MLNIFYLFKTFLWTGNDVRLRGGYLRIQGLPSHNNKRHRFVLKKLHWYSTGESFQPSFVWSATREFIGRSARHADEFSAIDQYDIQPKHFDTLPWLQRLVACNVTFSRGQERIALSVMVCVIVYTV